MIDKREEFGASEAFLDFQDRVSSAARVDRPVLCIGERGSGKELTASKLHYLSPRWDKPFVPLNCATLPESLIESELFGYEKGAFTGATSTRQGRFELANGGTLFLDEIGLIPISVQEKILRVVEYGTFERVGSSNTISVDVRIVGATNANLPELCKQGVFKQDLLDRLSFDVIFVPPLRHRKDDILLLAEHFASRMSREMGGSGELLFSEDMVSQLLGYSWPGNIRELKNVIERAVYHGAGESLGALVFDPFQNPYEDQLQPVDRSIQYTTGENGEGTEPKKAPHENPKDSNYYEYPLHQMGELLLEVQRTFVHRALEESGGNKRKAADLMGVSYDQFRGLERKVKSAE